MPSRQYTVITYNTITHKYEEVSVSKDVYLAYRRTLWNIKDNNRRFYDHEIQMSSLIGGEDGNYENFREFINAEQTPETEYLNKERKEIGILALSCLSETMRRRFLLHYDAKLTVTEIAHIEGVSEYSVKESLKLARRKLVDFLAKNSQT